MSGTHKIKNNRPVVRQRDDELFPPAVIRFSSSAYGSGRTNINLVGILTLAAGKKTPAHPEDEQVLLTVGAEVDNRRELQNDKSGPDDGTAQSSAAEPLPSMGTGGRTRRGRHNEKSGPNGAASSSTSGVLLSVVAGVGFEPTTFRL